MCVYIVGFFHYNKLILSELLATFGTTSNVFFKCAVCLNN